MKWDDPASRILIGPVMLRNLEEQAKIRKHLNEAQDCQKIYTNAHRFEREFLVGDHVFLWIRPKKSFSKLGNCTKLIPN
jgi:hypothetical protein